MQVYLCGRTSTDRMAPGRFSTRAKIVIVVCCMLIVIASVLVYTGYTAQAAERKHKIQLHLQHAAGRMAAGLNGDGLLALKPGDEGSPSYVAFARALNESRKNDSFIVTAYLLRVDNGTITYVVHDAYLTRGLDPYVVRTGEPVTEDRDVILNAMVSGPVFSPDI